MVNQRLFAFAFLVMLLCASAPAAEAPPYGDPEFYPSPERPIGFRGDGNGCFPGATPVREFWEGTPVETEQTYQGKRGPETDDYLAITDDQSKNLVWKTHMPSWANGHPIVVGDKIFTLGEPDWLICIDAASGEVLWSKQVRVWDTLLEDADLADRIYDMFEIYLSLSAVIDGQFRGRSPNWSPEEYRPMREIMATEAIPRMRERLAVCDPETDYAPLLDQVLEGMDLFIADSENFGKAEKVIDGKRGVRRKLKRRIHDLGGEKVDVDFPWGNMIGWCMSVPVSDGKHVYASFGQGQLACFDLAGNLVWQRWMEPVYGRTDPVQSPLLKGSILVDMHGGGRELRGVDTASGRLVWRAPTRSAELERHKGGYFVGSHKILTLPNPAGEPMDVVVTTLCNIVRLSDGKVVGYLPWEWDYGPSGGPSIFNCGDIVYRSANGDGGGCPFTAWRLSVVDGDRVEAEVVWHLGKKGSPGYQGQIATGSHLLMTKDDFAVVDGRSGEVLVKGRRRHNSLGNLSNILAGDLWIWADSGHRDPLYSYWGRRRHFDGKTAMRFFAADMSDLAHPKRLQTTSVLGGDNIPHFPPYERWIGELYEQNLLWGAWNGLPSHFMHTDTGILPQGDRLFIRSVSHLYCIGDPSREWHTPSAAPPAARR